MSLTKYELRLLEEQVRNGQNMSKTEATELLVEMGMFDEKGNLLEPYRDKPNKKLEKDQLEPK